MFFVIELKLNVERKDDLAQLFLELLSAAERNKRNNYTGLRVYGLLTDLVSFYPYSYDPVQNAFFKDDMFIANITRELFCSDMIHVANKIFSILMYGYIKSLEATVALSKARSEKQDLSDKGSSLMQQMTNSPSIMPPTSRVAKKPACPSLTAWERGLALAKEAQEMFSKGVSTGSIEALEGTTTSALKILTQSVHCLPRSSHYTGPSVEPATLEDLADDALQTWYKRHLATLGDSELEYGATRLVRPGRSRD